MIKRIGLVLTALVWSASPSIADTIAIIGTGGVGSALGPQFAAAGHSIVYGSRTPDSPDVQALVDQTGHGARATTQTNAARDADLIVLAIPWAPAESIVAGLGNLDGKIIVDPINALTFSAESSIGLAVPSAAQTIQDWAPNAHVVKAFNTLTRAYMVDPSSANGPITVPIAGNNEEAKDKVAALVDAMGLEPLDMGDLSLAVGLEGMGLLYVAQGYQDRTRFEFHLRPR